MIVPARSGCVVKMKILLIVVLVSCMCVCLVYGQEDNCDILGGECISIANCPVLKSYIQLSPSTRDLVMDYHCGFNGSVPNVCCQPDDCTTFDLMSKTCSVDYALEDYSETGVHILWCYNLLVKMILRKIEN